MARFVVKNYELKKMMQRLHQTKVYWRTMSFLSLFYRRAVTNVDSSNRGQTDMHDIIDQLFARKISLCWSEGIPDVSQHAPSMTTQNFIFLVKSDQSFSLLAQCKPTPTSLKNIRMSLLETFRSRTIWQHKISLDLIELDWVLEGKWIQGNWSHRRSFHRRTRTSDSAIRKTLILLKATILSSHLFVEVHSLHQ